MKKKQNKNFKKILISGACGFALLGIGGLALMESQGKQNDFAVSKPESSMTKEEKKVSVEYKDEGIGLIDQYHASEINFYDFSIKFKEITKNHSKMSQTDLSDLMSAYSGILEIEEARFNEMIGLMAGEVYEADRTEGVSLTEGTGLSKIQSPLVKSLVSELKQNDMILRKDKSGEIFVTANYTGIKESFGENLTSFMKDYLNYKEEVSLLLNYDYEVGSPHFEDLFSKIKAIESYEKDDKEKDDFFWEYERFGAVTTFLAFGDGSANLTETKVNDRYVEGMQIFLEKHKEEKSQYISILSDVLAQIEKEGAYGEETMKVANDFINSSFSEYLTAIQKTEDELKKESESKKENKDNTEETKSDESLEK